MTSVVPGAMSVIVNVPALSVTNLPLALPMRLPSESVTRNSTSEMGAFVTASTFFTSTPPLG